MAIEHAITHLAVDHLQEVRGRKLDLVGRTEQAVKDRLTKEINYWDFRASQLRELELAGHPNARLNSDKARSRADDLQVRLKNRLEELAQEKQIVAQPPVVVGGALIIPAGLLARQRGERKEEPQLFAHETRRVEALAMQAVIAAENQLGFEPSDVAAQKIGYDIESRVPDSGKLRFIEVKGRIEGAKTVTVTKNEILTAFNKPEDFILALVLVPPAEFPGDAYAVHEPVPGYGLYEGCRVHYLRQPFSREPDFAATSVNYDLEELLGRATMPK